jgi:hypothetical protein
LAPFLPRLLLRIDFPAQQEHPAPCVIERGHFACCLRTQAPAFSFARADGAALAPGAVA